MTTVRLTPIRRFFGFVSEGVRLERIRLIDDRLAELKTARADVIQQAQDRHWALDQMERKLKARKMALELQG